MRRTPLPRIWKAQRWFAMHPPTALCVRLYLGIEKPGEKPGRPEPVTEEEVDRLGALLGMRKG